MNAYEVKLSLVIEAKSEEEALEQVRAIESTHFSGDAISLESIENIGIATNQSA